MGVDGAGNYDIFEADGGGGRDNLGFDTSGGRSAPTVNNPAEAAATARRNLIHELRQNGATPQQAIQLANAITNHGLAATVQANGGSIVNGAIISNPNAQPTGTVTIGPMFSSGLHTGEYYNANGSINQDGAIPDFWAGISSEATGRAAGVQFDYANRQPAGQGALFNAVVRSFDVDRGNALRGGHNVGVIVGFGAGATIVVGPAAISAATPVINETVLMGRVVILAFQDTYGQILITAGLPTSQWILRQSTYAIDATFGAPGSLPEWSFGGLVGAGFDLLDKAKDQITPLLPTSPPPPPPPPSRPASATLARED